MFTSIKAFGHKTKDITSNHRSPGREGHRKRKRSTYDLSLKGRDRAVVGRTNVATVSKGNAGETSHRQDGEMFAFVVSVKMLSFKGNAGETSHRQDGEMFAFVVSVKMLSSLVTGFQRPVNHTGSPQDEQTSLLLLFMIAFISRYSPLSSRLTALACDST